MPFTILRGAMIEYDFQYIIKKYIFQMSSNLKANCYEFTTGCRKLYFLSVWYRKLKKVGKHCYTKSKSLTKQKLKL